MNRKDHETESEKERKMGSYNSDVHKVHRYGQIFLNFSYTPSIHAEVIGDKMKCCRVLARFGWHLYEHSSMENLLNRTQHYCELEIKNHRSKSRIVQTSVKRFAGSIKPNSFQGSSVWLEYETNSNSKV